MPGMVQRLKMKKAGLGSIFSRLCHLVLPPGVVRLASLFEI